MPETALPGTVISSLPSRLSWQDAGWTSRCRYLYPLLQHEHQGKSEWSISLLTPTRRLFVEPLPSSPLIMSSPYSDNGNPDTNMKPIQLCSIRWDASGPNELTFNLAIWALHIIAALDREVRSDYPSIADDPKYKNWKTGKIGQKTLTMAVLISYRWFCGSGGCFKLGKGGVVLVVGGGLLPEVGQGRCFSYERSVEIYNVMTRGCQ